MAPRRVAGIFAAGLYAAPWAWILAGCAADSPVPDYSPEVDSASPPPAALPAYDPATATARILVHARVAGDLPRRHAIHFEADEVCASEHPLPVLEETIVATDGNLANVVVWVSRGTERWAFSPPAEKVVLEQRGCMYEPHVLSMSVGQPLVLRNHDKMTHEHHLVGKQCDLHCKRTPRGGEDVLAVFAEPEIPIKIKCDVHNWMWAWIAVLPHPFHGVTGPEGRAEIRVPPGGYEISAWHEYGEFSKPEPRRLSLREGETKEIEFTFAVQ